MVDNVQVFVDWKNQNDKGDTLVVLLDYFVDRKNLSMEGRSKKDINILLAGLIERK